MKLNAIIASAAIAFGIGLSGCNFLDVVPPEQAQLPDATKSYDNSLGFLYSCYGGIYNPMTEYSAAEAAADEWVLPPTWNETMHNYLRGLVTASAANDWRWGNHYRFIGQCYLFLQELEKGKIDDYMSEAEKEEFRRTARAEANFMIAYYHMQALIGYGPIPIMTEYIDMNADKSLYPGRSHFDYCVDWICNKFDEAANDLPATREGTEWGRATSVIAKALKSRLLVYAASPLWNGSFYEPTWKNKVETPGYGYELVSNTYDPQKWERAKQATIEALNLAIQSGHELYNDLEWYTKENNITLPYVPGIDGNTPEGLEFQKRVMMLRYLVTTKVNQGNKEIIWGIAPQGNWTAGALPHHVLVQTNGQVRNGYSGVSPLLSTSISFFYTKNGKRPADDPQFYPENEWFKSAGLSGDRSRIINLNVSREPRFYAWFAFDGGDFGTHLKNGAPLTINLLDPNEQGFNATVYQRDNNVTGYFSQKFFPPTTRATVDGSYTAPASPRPVIRLAELYLNLAECYANLGETENALKNLNVIRERAGVPDLTASDVTGNMSLVDWAINERFIELWGEGHRYYDVRRYKIAPQTMADGMRTGLNAWDVTGPSFEVFNTPVKIDEKGGNYVWIDRMYVMPVFDNEVYKNPQMVQAPGY